jgi:metallo-beta-lactamase class B
MWAGECYRLLLEGHMKSGITAVAAAIGLAFALSAATVAQQSVADGHFAKARAAAGSDFTDIFDTSCGYIRPEAVIKPAPAAAAAAQTPPARSTWHAEPVKVFDNLYFIGQTEYSAWAVTTSDGIIVMDAIFDYSVDDEVVRGLTALGFDPKQIKYVIVSHAHGDHVGGAKWLQDRGAHIVMSAADWDLLERSRVTFAKPTRDIVASDGQKLTLGDTTITMYLTPGHTLGTISSIIPVKDGGTTHMAAYWGGTAFNWVRGPAAYITPERPASFWFDAYAQSAERFRDLAARAGADVVLSNHTKYDLSTTKLALVQKGGRGSRNPYVIGKENVQRFFTIAAECGQAGVATTK